MQNLGRDFNLIRPEQLAKIKLTARIINFWYAKQKKCFCMFSLVCIAMTSALTVTPSKITIYKIRLSQNNQQVNSLLGGKLPLFVKKTSEKSQLCT